MYLGMALLFEKGRKNTKKLPQPIFTLFQQFPKQGLSELNNPFQWNRSTTSSPPLFVSPLLFDLSFTWYLSNYLGNIPSNCTSGGQGQSPTLSLSSLSLTAVHFPGTLTCLQPPQSQHATERRGEVNKCLVATEEQHENWIRASPTGGKGTSLHCSPGDFPM